MGSSTRLVVGLVLCLLVSVPPVSAREEAAPVTAEQVRLGFEHAGYSVDTPIYWSSSRLTTLFVSDGVGVTGRVLLVLVYPDLETAREQQRTAHVSQEADLGLGLAFNDQQGPQLIAGYGRSSWWLNVAVVQATRPASFGLVDASADQVERFSTDASRRAAMRNLNSVDPDFVLVMRGVGSVDL
jgi:hypothetical protein